jgi:hypothetical protein
VGLAGRARIDLDAPVQAGAVGGPAAAPAQQDPPVPGRAEVVQEGAAVGDALAARPAQPLDHVGHGLGEDDVGRGHRQPRAELGQPAHRRSGREHGGAGAHAAGGRLGQHAVSARLQPPHARALEQQRAALHEPASQPEREPRRLQRREVGDQDASAEEGRVAARTRLARPQLDHPLGCAERGRGRRRLAPDTVEGGRRRHAHVAGPVEPGVHVLGTGPVADRGHGVARGVQQRSRKSVAEAAPQRRGRQPHRLAEAAVAPARAVSADIALEQGHRGTRLEHVPGRPHPCVAAADHHHVGADGPVERRTRLYPSGLVQPPPPGGVAAYVRILDSNGQDPSCRREALSRP